jgi:nucleoside 2-deoxyribosyltransferase
MVIALLDGSQVDDGTAWEIGYAFARGIPVYGIRTDSRSAGETGHSRVNAMIEGSLSGFATSLQALFPLISRTTQESL